MQLGCPAGRAQSFVKRKLSSAPCPNPKMSGAPSEQSFGVPHCCLCVMDDGGHEGSIEIQVGARASRLCRDRSCAPILSHSKCSERVTRRQRREQADQQQRGVQCPFPSVTERKRSTPPRAVFDFRRSNSALEGARRPPRQPHGLLNHHHYLVSSQLRGVGSPAAVASGTMGRLGVPKSPVRATETLCPLLKLLLLFKLSFDGPSDWMEGSASMWARDERNSSKARN